MGREDRNAATDLIERLQTTAASSSFFQIVRLFNRVARRAGGAKSRAGIASRPKEEPVRFRAATGMRHPAAEIVSAEARALDGAPELTVSFMGLTGPMGVLPDYYTELLVTQRQARNPAAADFLDLFNHRTISLFYRAWAKYRLPIRFEEAARPLEDPHSRALAALMGLGLDASRPMLSADGGDLMSIAGPMARRVRTADGLRRTLASLFELPVEVIELQGRWIPIRAEEQTRLGEVGGFAVLGETAVIGSQVWDVQSRFRVRIGPVDLETFKRFFGAGDLRKSLVDLIRLSVGPAAEFDLQPVLKREYVPGISLGDSDNPALLGQTSWVVSKAPERDRDDAVVDGRWRPLEQVGA